MSYEMARALMKHSVSRPTLYSIEMPVLNRSINDYIKLFARTVTVPSITAETNKVIGQEMMNVSRDQTRSVMFGKPLTMEIIENSDFGAYTEFRRIFNRVSTGLDGRSNSRSQRMNYYDDIKFDMTVNKLESPHKGSRQIDQSDRIDQGYINVAQFNFTNCFVSKLSELNLNSETKNSMLTFSVNIKYETYQFNNLV